MALASALTQAVTPAPFARASTAGTTVVGAPSSTDPEVTLQYQVLMRQALGYDSSEAHIRALWSAVDSTERYGLWLDPTEVANMDHRDALADKVATGLLPLAKANPGAFGGVQIVNPGRVRLYVTPHGIGVFDAALASFDPRDVEVVQVLKSFNALQAAATDVGSESIDWSHMNGLSLAGVGVDIARNTVRIQLRNYTAATAAAVSARWPDAEVEPGADLRPTGVDDTDKDQPYSPLRSGLTLRANDSWAECSLGLPMYKNPYPSPIEYYISTAGHCYNSPNDSTVVYQGRVDYPTRYRAVADASLYSYNNGRHADVMIARLRNDALRVRATYESPARTNTPWVTATNTMIEGEMVCFAGLNSDNTYTQTNYGYAYQSSPRCGRVVDTAYGPHYSANASLGVSEVQFASTFAYLSPSRATLPGDSGGPVFADHQTSFAGRGTVSGGVDPGPTGLFGDVVANQIDGMEYETGTVVCFSC